MLVGGALAGLGGFTQLAGVEYKLRPGFLAHVRLHRLPGQLAGPPPPVPGRPRRDAAGRHRGRRRQPATRLRAPGSVGERPHGPRPARRLRVGRPKESGGGVNLGLEVMAGGVARRHLDPLRRARRDGVGARRRREPRHRGQHALRRARRLRGERGVGQPVDRRARRRGRGRARWRRCTPTSC